MYCVQLLPIEMISLCNLASKVDPEILIKNISWHFLSQNENIDLEFLTKYEKKPWHFADLFRNSAITLTEFCNHPAHVLYYRQFSANPNLTIEFVLKNRTENWDWYLISRNKAITMHDVYNNRTLHWNYHGISANPNLTIDFVLNDLSQNWSWYDISRNKSITLQDICDNPQLPWDMCALLANPNITMTFSLSIITKISRFAGAEYDIAWGILSQNKAITMDDVFSNIHRRWDYFTLPLNPNLTLAFILETLNIKNKRCNWNWSDISTNKSITIEEIQENPQLPWDILSISSNPNITMEYVLANIKEKPMFQHRLCKNPGFFIY